jgi:hypothetical protein
VWRILLVLAGCAAPPDCSEQAQFLAELSPGTYGNCGNFGYDNYEAGMQNPDPAPYRAAHDCLLAATVAEEPIVASSSIGEIDGASTYVFEGTMRDGRYQIFEIAYGRVAVGGATESSTISACSSLVDLGTACDVTASFCLGCADATPVSTCSEPI